MLIPKATYESKREYRKWLSQFPCVKCGMYGRSQVAHLGQSSWGKKACDSTCAPLCCNGIDHKGCHEKLDQYMACDKRYWDENKGRMIEKMRMVYAFWKAKKLNDAEYLIRSITP